MGKCEHEPGLAPELDERAEEAAKAIGLISRLVPVEPVERRVVAVRVVVAALPAGTASTGADCM